jgi:hypothetical protein
MSGELSTTQMQKIFVQITVATEILRDDLFVWMSLCFRKYHAFLCCFVMV